MKAHPGTVFVVEDLDLRGSKGAKRFAYRALHHNLATKAPCKVVNPAYSSQTCPSCGYVSRNNRKGIKFVCRSCGRKSHADVVGGAESSRTFRGQRDPARRSSVRSEGSATKAIRREAKESRGIVNNTRACTVRPEAYYRSTSRDRHSLESGDCPCVSLSNFPSTVVPTDIASQIRRRAKDRRPTDESDSRCVAR